MRVMRAKQEQHDGHAEQELFRRCILVSVVDLLPHAQVVVGARVELEGHAADVVEHEIGAGDVEDVGEGPGQLLCDTWDDVEEDLEAKD